MLTIHGTYCDLLLYILRFGDRGLGTCFRYHGTGCLRKQPDVTFLKVRARQIGHYHVCVLYCHPRTLVSSTSIYCMQCGTAFDVLYSEVGRYHKRSRFNLGAEHAYGSHSAVQS